MKYVRMFVLFLVVAVAVSIASSRGQAQSSVGVASPSAQSQAVQILDPVAGQTLSSRFVDLRFELMRPAPYAEPNFLVQLDSADPMTTSDTDYTLSDLQPGIHTVRITLVDANNVPVEGGTATVQFKVPSTAQAATDSNSPGEAQLSTRSIFGAAPTAPIPPELRHGGDSNLPLAGSPLPLLSLVGFGLLLGGAIQGMRARQ